MNTGDDERLNVEIRTEGDTLNCYVVGPVDLTPGAPLQRILIGSIVIAARTLMPEIYTNWEQMMLQVILGIAKAGGHELIDVSPKLKRIIQ